MQQHDVKRHRQRADDHKYGNDNFYIQIVIKQNGFVFGRKTGRRNGGHGMIDRIKPVHSGPVQTYCAQTAQKEIDPENAFGDIMELRHKLVVKIRIFPLKHLHAADSEKRQQSHRKHNDAGAAHGRQHRPPQQNRLRLRLYVGQNRRTRRRQPRHGFKQGIVKIVGASVKHERNGGQQRNRDPAGCRQQISLADADILHRRPVGKKQRKPDKKAKKSRA